MKLPDAKTHPNGRVHDLLETNANPGSNAKFEDSKTIVSRTWGLVVKEKTSEADRLKFGLPLLGGGVGVQERYILRPDGTWKLEQIKIEQ